MSKPQGFVQNLPEQLDVTELIDALNDPGKAKDLMARHDWTMDDLVSRAELVSKRIASGIANVNCV